MSSLKDLLKREAEEQESYADERTSSQKEWIEAVDRLIHRLEGWLREVDTKGALKIESTIHQIGERRIGFYEARGLRITLGSRSLGPREIRVKPIERDAIGSVVGDPVGKNIKDGRVDMTNFEKKYIFYRRLRDEGEEWVMVDDRDYRPTRGPRAFRGRHPEYARMMMLAEAWGWYQTTRTNLRLLERPASKHWNQLPLESDIWKDDHFRNISAAELAEESTKSWEELEELAIVLLFASFEAWVRTRLLEDIKEEKNGIRHPVLSSAAQEPADAIDRGSFFKVLTSLKTLDHDLVEQVRQGRRYRNWISHGKRGVAPSRVTPKVAYDRLTSMIAAIQTGSG